MSQDEVKQLKLGDYVKRSVVDRSDEYYMVTGIGKEIKLRKVGSSKLSTMEDNSEYILVDTSRDK